jgi:phosphoribosylaminoimidazole carboxylase/phosphoribosylaminoimidazole-succinocarboxamide synthase
VSAQFKFNGVKIGKDKMNIMRWTTMTVFEVLQKAWVTRDCTLIDLKIQFGVDSGAGKHPYKHMLANNYYMEIKLPV